MLILLNYLTFPHNILLLSIFQGAFSRLDPTGEWADKLLDILPVGRLGEVPEIANLVSYMVSDYSSWMSGEVRNSQSSHLHGQWLL